MNPLNLGIMVKEGIFYEKILEKRLNFMMMMPLWRPANYLFCTFRAYSMLGNNS